MKSIRQKAESIAKQKEDVDADEVEAELKEMTEFDVPLREAVESVKSRHNIGQDGNEVVPLADLDPGDWGSVEVRVVKLFDADHDAVAQSGLIAAGETSATFTIWAKSLEQNQKIEPVEEGDSIKMGNISTDEFNGDLNIQVNSNSEIVHLDEEVEVADTVTGEVTVEGALVDIYEGSGLIRRCNRDGCNRTLEDSGGRCSEHGNVDYEWDLRIKGVLDTGEKTVRFIAGQEITERLTGISLQDAVKQAEDSLDTGIVLRQFRRQLVGRPLGIEGPVIDDQVLANEAFWSTFDQADADELLEQVVEGRVQHDRPELPNTSRSPAIRMAAAEVNQATRRFETGDGQYDPTVGVAPSGALVNRALIAGTVTEVEDIGDSSEYYRMRVVDPTGTVTVYAGQYDDALPEVKDLEPPAYVVVVGKHDTFEADGDTYACLRPESVLVVDEDLRDYYLLKAVEQTFRRLARLQSDPGHEGVAKARAVYDSPVFSQDLKKSVLETLVEVSSMDEDDVEFSVEAEEASADSQGDGSDETAESTSAGAQETTSEATEEVSPDMDI